MEIWATARNRLQEENEDARITTFPKRKCLEQLWIQITLRSSESFRFRGANFWCSHWDIFCRHTAWDGSLTLFCVCLSWILYNPTTRPIVSNVWQNIQTYSGFVAMWHPSSRSHRHVRIASYHTPPLQIRDSISQIVLCAGRRDFDRAQCSLPSSHGFSGCVSMKHWVSLELHTSLFITSIQGCILKLHFHVRLRLKIAPAGWHVMLGRQVAGQTDDTGQAAWAISSLNLTFKESLRHSKLVFEMLLEYQKNPDLFTIFLD